MFSHQLSESLRISADRIHICRGLERSLGLWMGSSHFLKPGGLRVLEGSARTDAIEEFCNKQNDVQVVPLSCTAHFCLFCLCLSCTASLSLFEPKTLRSRRKDAGLRDRSRAQTRSATRGCPRRAGEARRKRPEHENLRARTRASAPFN